MNGLEALGRIKQCLKAKNKLIFNTKGIAQIEKELKDGEKYKKALEIINKKTYLDFNDIRNADNYDEYLKHFGKVIQEMLRSDESVHFAVTKEEFHLLKEVLK